jgi:hypothetical protein
MKRKDLKAGEWYLETYNQPPLVGERRVMATAEKDIMGHCVYFTDLEFVDAMAVHVDKYENDDVTPCDPPEWFSEVWVRR